MLTDNAFGRMVRDNRPDSRATFNGHIRQFIFNNKRYIDLAYRGMVYVWRREIYVDLSRYYTIFVYNIMN